jgi:molybdopterin converting factor subunit 1
VPAWPEAALRIRLLAFATAADALGAKECDFELPSPGTVADLRRSLATSYPALAPFGGRLAIAVDGDLARDDVPLADGAEVALLPPVSGG